MRISVIIPVYNEASCLAACLEALAAQTRRADEIIVVDNNSTDRTGVIAEQYGAQVIQEPVQGILPAVCTGFDASTGGIIARCDADSIVPPDWLERIESVLSDRPDAAAITGPGTFYGPHHFWNRLAQFWYMQAYFGLVGLALANWPLFGSNCALRRETWLAVRDTAHRLRADIHDDMDISLHIAPTNPVLYSSSLRVGISARSLRLRGMAGRYAKGFRSLYIHWPADAPWVRWRKRLGR